eukprot:TRINITY_DN12390_c0_g1_i1.p1 TRINITY_DN12390_c0_g1~~TRINITY_DN12390_c0_g1_i1.p1  ORF type:complete len:248 (+),score=26.90 TRINITY_DN12390_c0_g1_i1:429-1172(+)
MSSAPCESHDACPYCRRNFASFSAVLDHLSRRECHQVYTRPLGSRHAAEDAAELLSDTCVELPAQLPAELPAGLVAHPEGDGSASHRDALRLFNIYKHDLMRAGGSTKWGPAFAPSMLEKIWLPYQGAAAAKARTERRLADGANGAVESEEEQPQKLMCGQCGAVLSNNGNLNRHIRAVHSDIRRFKCAQCEWAFHRRSELRLHVMRVHYSVRAHRCNQCEKSYTRKEHLTRHLRSYHSSSKRRRRK